MKQTFDVTGMTCAACSARVEKATRAVPGVADVAVNLLKNSMDVAFDDGVEPSAVTAAVEAGARYAKEQGVFVGQSILGAPHEELWNFL